MTDEPELDAAAVEEMDCAISRAIKPGIFIDTAIARAAVRVMNRRIAEAVERERRNTNEAVIAMMPLVSTLRFNSRHLTDGFELHIARADILKAAQILEKYRARKEPSDA